MNPNNKQSKLQAAVFTHYKDRRDFAGMGRTLKKTGARER